MAVKTTIRTPMPIKMRAKQFAMFDALKGLTEAIVEKERQVYMRKELSEEIINEINSKLCKLSKGDQITVVYFCEYRRAECRSSGIVTRIDPYLKSLQVGHVSIGFGEIIDIHYANSDLC